jgi:hypothetical protein
MKPNEEADWRKNNLSKKGVVSGIVCQSCNGTAIKYRDYYDEDNNMEIVTIKEKCSCCNGTGVDKKKLELRKIEETTHKNAELIASFMEHCKQGGVSIHESLFESFFNA